MKRFAEEFEVEDEMPVKRQRKGPELPAETVTYWERVRGSLDTQVAEIEKYRETTWKPHCQRLSGKEKKFLQKHKETRELEKEVAEMKKAKGEMKKKIDKMEAEIKGTRTHLHVIENKKY